MAATLPDSFRGVFERFSPRQRWLKRAAGISDAYGLSLLLTIATFLVASMLPHEDWARVVTVTLVGATSLVGLASSSVSRNITFARRRGLRCSPSSASAVGEFFDFKLGVIVAFALTGGLLFVTAFTILGKVLSQKSVTFRTILGALTTYTMLGLLFGFAYLVVDLIQTAPFFVDGLRHR